MALYLNGVLFTSIFIPFVLLLLLLPAPAAVKVVVVVVVMYFLFNKLVFLGVTTCWIEIPLKFGFGNCWIRTFSRPDALVLARTNDINALNGESIEFIDC